MHRSTLVVFSLEYPNQGKGDSSFLPEEMEYLARRFQRVILVPKSQPPRTQHIDSKLEVDESYSASYKSRSRGLRALLAALHSPLLYREICDNPFLFRHSPTWERLVRMISGAQTTRQWTLGFIKRKQLDLANTLFYTFWMDDTALGIGCVKTDHPKLRLVSRAHNFDLYEERRQPAYLPCRRSTLAGLDRLFLVSDHGKRYISGRYPEYRSICEVARLGVRGRRSATSPSLDGKFCIVSCSNVVSLKRVDLLMRGIAHAGRERPGQEFEWHYLGDGPLADAIRQSKDQLLPANVKGHLWGHLSKTDVLSFYENNPADVFVAV